MNTGFVVLRLMVHRFRRLYLVFSCYLVGLVILAHLPKEWISEPIAGLLCMPFMLGLLTTVFGFVSMEADIASPSSAYSPWMLRLPLRTGALAVFPMVAASVWGAASWIVFASCYLRPRGIDAPIWWPALLFIALALSLQSILWCPFRRGEIRLIIAIATTTAIGLFGLIAAGYDWSSEKISLVYAVLCVAFAGLAWAGLARARTSPSTARVGPDETQSASPQTRIRRTKKAFRSPRTAQFWLEWRRQGRLLPMLTSFGLAAMSLPLLLSHETQSVYGDESVRANIWISIAFPYLPWIPLLFATVIGMGARPADIRGTEGVYHLYHATRPMSSRDMYRAKTHAITAGVMLTALITIGTMLTWALIPSGIENGSPTSYYGKNLATLAPANMWLLVGMAVALTAWTWRNQTVGAFVDYLPSKNAARAYPAVVVLGGAAALSFSQELRVDFQDANSPLWLSALFGVLLLTKIGLAAAFSLKLVRLRPASSGDLISALATWALFAGIAAATFGWIAYAMPKGALPVAFQHPVPELFAALLVPLARPFAARIALECGRHR